MTEHEVAGSGSGEPQDRELDDLLGRLRLAVLDLDDVPPLVSELARAAFETRDLDLELMALTADSAVDVGDLVRGTATEPRIVSFEIAADQADSDQDAADDAAPALTVDLQIDHQDDGVMVRGVVLGHVQSVVLEQGADRHEVPVDAQGWFTVSVGAERPFRLRVRRADGSTAGTEWIAL